MSSGDFMNLTFRNTTTYRPDGSFIPEGYIFTVSSYGKQNWTNNLRLNNLVVSTFTLNSTFIVASTNTNNMVIFSTLTVSSTETRHLTYSTMIGDSILTNNLTLANSLNVGSTFTSLAQASTFAGSSIGVRALTASTANTLFQSVSSLSTGTQVAQTMTVASTLTGSTMTMDGASMSTVGISSLLGGAAQITNLLTTSSLFVPGQTVFSTMLGSTVTANALTLQSTLVGSSIQCVNLLSERATVNALTVPSTAVISTAVLNLANVSSFLASTLTTGLTLFSTMIGAAITASTMTLNTVIINSTLTTSTFATGSLNFSTLVGSSIVNNILAVTSTATISTTTTSTLIVNRQTTTPADPPYKLVLEQGSGQNENALYIGNSNSGSAQGLSIGMVNEGFSYFGTYAKIQGKRGGSAGTTNVVLQSDEGKVGIGTTNPDALLDIYAPSGTPGTMFLYNGMSGTNTTGVDVTVSALNMGSSGSGLYYGSVRIRVPNGAETSATRMDLCTPASVSDNTQRTRMSIAPYTGYVGIGTTGSTNLLQIHSGSTNLAALRLTSGSAGWGNGMLFENTTAMTGRTYGIYTDSLMGAFRFTDVTASTDRIVIDSTGNVGVGTNAPYSRMTIADTDNPTANVVNIEAGVFSDRSSASAGWSALNFNGYYSTTDRRVNTGKNRWRLAVDQRNSTDAMWIDTYNGTTVSRLTTWLPSGYVGISTATPTNLLHIYSNSTNQAAIRLTSGSTGWGSGMVFENTTATTGRSYGIYSDGPLGMFHIQDVTASLDRMVIDSTGKVGIGITTPTYSLDLGVGFTTNLGGYLTTRFNDMGYTAANAVVHSGGTISGSGPYTFTTNAVNGSIRITTTLASASTYRISITCNITVGSGYLIVTDGVGTIYTSPTLTSSYQTFAFSGTAVSNGQIFYFQVMSASGTVFNYSSISISRGDVAASGNVGIGTTNSSRLLHLYNTTTAYSLYIDQGLNNNGNGIYVTNSNYGSNQGISISMVNAGSSNFNSYAQIQGHTSGVAGTTHVVLQPSGGYVGIGLTAPTSHLQMPQGYLMDMGGALNTQFTTASTDYSTAAFTIGYNSTSYTYAASVGTYTVAGADTNGQLTMNAAFMPGATYRITTTLATNGTMPTNYWYVRVGTTVLVTTAITSTATSYTVTFIPTSTAINFLFSVGASKTVTISAFTVTRMDTIVKGFTGIGTTSPLAPLDVWGGIYSRGAYQQTGGFMKGYAIVGVVSGLALGSCNGASELGNLYVTDGGRVGIGTSNPGYKLDVQGDIRSTTGIVITSNSALSWNGTSTCQIYTTTSDAYTVSSLLNNLIIRSWWGIGFSDYENKVRIAMDTRTGNAQFDGTLTCGTLTCSTLNATNINVIPTGIITLWYGNTSNIPSGWALCNGSNGTPDLRDKFIVGAGNTYTSGSTGGNAKNTLTVAQLPAHTHGVNDPGHQHWYEAYARNTGNNADSGSAISAKDNPLQRDYLTSLNTTGITIQSTGSGAEIENRPPYYALCYIMKL